MNLRFGIFLLALCCAMPALADFISATPTEGVITHERNPMDEDQCPPQTIVSIPLVLNGNTSSSANDYPSSCYFSEAPDDIYALSLFCRGTITASLCGSAYDCLIEVRAGTNYFDCPGSTLLACNDDFCGLQSQVTFYVEAGETYFIIVDGFSSNSGAYSLGVSGVFDPPPNDNCADAMAITSLPFEHFGSTTCATNSVNPWCAIGNAPDVWYTLQLPCDANVTATTCGHPLMDAVLHVYAEVNPCDDYTQVVCNDDNCADFQSSVSFAATASQIYYIVVDGYNTDSGYYVLNVSNNDTHPEDACPGAEITSFPTTLTGNTACLINDYLQSCVEEANEAVYYFTVPECMRVTASLCGSGYDAQVEVRTGAGCPGDSLIICRDDWYCDDVWTLTPSVVFDAFPGYSYQIFVGGYFGSTGAYTLNVDAITCPIIPAVVDMVALPDIPNGNMQLFWNAVDGADYYEIHAIPTEPYIPGNPVDIAYGTTYTHVGVINNFASQFYRVIAVDLPEAPGGQPMTIDKPIPPQTPVQQPVQVPPWLVHDYSASQNK